MRTGGQRLPSAFVRMRRGRMSVQIFPRYAVHPVLGSRRNHSATRMALRVVVTSINS